MLGGKYYGAEFYELEHELDNLHSHLDNQEPVILVIELNDLDRIGIDPRDVIVAGTSDEDDTEKAPGKI
jgi:uncharacterized protein YpbB